MSLQSIRYNPTQMELTQWSLIKVTGADRESFFQGQVTNDLSVLGLNEAQLTARLNRNGKLQSFFFIAKCSDSLYILCPNELAEKIKTDFEKYIIMDDVVLNILKSPIWIWFNSFLLENKKPNICFNLNFYGINACLSFEKNDQLPLSDEKELEEIRILNGWPKWGIDVNESHFINDSYLNEIAISYKKGCFLGQETVAKIENNRGAAYFPVILKLNEPGKISNGEFYVGDRKGGEVKYQVNDLLVATLFRDFRVSESHIELTKENEKYKAVVVELPYFKASSRSEIALELYHLGVKAFQEDQLEVAMSTMKRALLFDSALADAYESLGVMLGRIEKFEEAIIWMDKLLEVNPRSVMAHTNKSLYLMRLGKIEEAESEKSIATVKSFAVFGEEAKLKKQLAEEQKKKEEETLRREKMFLQVLEIDEEDTIALYGMADIFYQRKHFLNSVENLKKVIDLNSKYSTAYLLLGKSYEALGELVHAKEIYQQGIGVASQQGDMMPANEMQSRLNQLVVSASFS